MKPSTTKHIILPMVTALGLSSVIETDDEKRETGKVMISEPANDWLPKHPPETESDPVTVTPSTPNAEAVSGMTGTTGPANQIPFDVAYGPPGATGTTGSTVHTVDRQTAAGAAV